MRTSPIITSENLKRTWTIFTRFLFTTVWTFLAARLISEKRSVGWKRRGASIGHNSTVREGRIARGGENEHGRMQANPARRFNEPRLITRWLHTGCATLKRYTHWTRPRGSFRRRARSLLISMIIFINSRTRSAEPCGSVSPREGNTGAFLSSLRRLFGKQRERGKNRWNLKTDALRFQSTDSFDLGS